MWATIVLGVKVWTDEWEWQCCGEEFAIGSVVEWNLVPLSPDDRAYFSKPLGDEIADDITHSETHHAYGLTDDDAQPITIRGRIGSIHAVYWESASLPGDEPYTVYPLKGTGVLEPRQTGGGGSEPESEDGPEFEGYIVDFVPLG